MSRNQHPRESAGLAYLGEIVAKTTVGPDQDVECGMSFTQEPESDSLYGAIGSSRSLITEVTHPALRTESPNISGRSGTPSGGRKRRPGASRMPSTSLQPLE